MGSSIYPGTPHANLFRAYPPSCAADPLPDRPSGPILASQRVTLYTEDGYGYHSTEDVTITVWRLSCSSSGSLTPYNDDGLYNAITLLRIDRDADADTTFYPTFPLITAQQGDSGGLDYDPSAPYNVVRLAVEPNTVISDTPFNAPVVNSTTYVLENYPYQDFLTFFYNYAFTLRIDPVAGDAPTDLSIPGYQPTQSTYPDAFAPLPLDGYAAAQWIGGVTGDDGLLVQVSEAWDSTTQTSFSRQVVFDLLTKDQNGNPIWLLGNGPFDEGATSTTIDTFYLGDGLSHVPWGSATLTLNDCNELDVTFTPNGGLPSPVPSFGGTFQYGRLFSENGMVCE
ncbi:MAG TPA: hypothetical protein VGC30_01710 [Dokdonella sp.]